MCASARNVIFVLTCGAVLCLTAAAPAQEWIARYNGPGNLADRARAIAVDDSGYVYATGWTAGVGTSDDMTTIKYAPSGDTLWVRRFEGPGGGEDRARAVTLDDSGNVYITGYSMSASGSHDFTTLKYSPEGDVVWIRFYDGPASGDDAAAGCAVDSDGNCYVTGQSWGGTNSDIATIKYSPSGDTLWTRRYNGPGDGYDAADGIVVDKNAYVYVGGSSTVEGPSSDMVTIKYSAAGDEEWVQHYNGSGNGDDEVRALAVDTAGEICVTGFSTGSGLTLDMTTIRYAATGDTLWVRRYDGPGDGTDQGWEVACDGDGNVHVTGASTQIGQERDCTTIKYSGSGDVLWARHDNGPGDGRDVAYGLALDSEGSVYAAGCVSRDASADFDKNDFFVVKYSPYGDTLWLRTLNGPGNAGDVVWDLAVDDSGSVYVAGHSVGTGTSYDFVTMKYRPCSVLLPGDVNRSSTLTSADIIYLVNYVFKTGAEPLPCTASGDVNCSGQITSADVIFMVNHVFKSEEPPCDVCNSALAAGC